MVSELDTPLIESHIDKLEIIDEENQLKISTTSPISLASSDLLCRICFEDEEMITLHCSHQICKKCLVRLKKRECPFCRDQFISKKKQMIKDPLPVRVEEPEEAAMSCNQALSHLLCLFLATSFIICGIYST